MNLTYTGISSKELPIDTHIDIVESTTIGFNFSEWLTQLAGESLLDVVRVDYCLRDTRTAWVSTDLFNY